MLPPSKSFALRKRRSILFVLLTVRIVAIFLSRSENPEPSFEGTSVTDWTQLVSLANPEDPGVQALIAIGPPAIPYVLKVYDGFGTKVQRSKPYSRVHQSLPSLLRKSLPRPTPIRGESSKTGLLFVLARIRPTPAEVEPFLAGQLQSDIPAIRFYACESLRLLGPCSLQTARKIVPLLSDTDPANRFCALRTLVELKKLDRSMISELDKLAQEKDAAWSNQIRALALFSLWVLRTPHAEVNFRNFLRNEPLQAIQWAVDPLKTDPLAAQTFAPYLLGRLLTSSDDREKEFLKETLANLSTVR